MLTGSSGSPLLKSRNEQDAADDENEDEDETPQHHEVRSSTPIVDLANSPPLRRTRLRPAATFTMLDRPKQTLQRAGPPAGRMRRFDRQHIPDFAVPIETSFGAEVSAMEDAKCLPDEISSDLITSAPVFNVYHRNLVFSLNSLVNFFVV